MNTRVQFKNYLTELFKRGNTQAGNNIHWNRPSNYSTDKKSSISIQSLSETAEKHEDTPRNYKRTYSITLELVSTKDSGDYIADEIQFENFIEEVDALMVSDERFRDKEILKALGLDDLCITDSVFDGIEYRTEQEGELPIYIALVKYDIIYYKVTGPKDSDLDNLNTIKTDMTPTPTNAKTSSIESEQRV